jgi:hypothetical protein
MSGEKKISPQDLSRLFWYDEKAGGLFSKKTGKRVDWHSHNGYRAFRVDGSKIYLHRAIYALKHKQWPSGIIDHADGNPANNKPENLRHCSKEENMRNRASLPKNNKSGVVGVSFDRHGKNWRACIVIEGKTKWLGRFASKAEAIHERLRAEAAEWGEYAPIINKTRRDHSFIDLPHFELK